MPLYIYTCSQCSVEVEELRPPSKADDPVACPVCGGMCVRGVALFAVSSGRKEKDPTRRKPAHPPGCPCCAAPRSNACCTSTACSSAA
ncbi:MAG: FmdB family zinc ribbon protein [Anaerolineae bacterium]|nr:FmdB family zinc ribbon protein [Anaerolineae bacterium]